MIEREVLKDIDTYKPKFIGPLTLRNFVCIAIAAAIAIPVFLILNIWFITPFCVLISSMCAAPALLCGFYQPYNEPLEKFFISFITQIAIAPKNRKYEIRSVDDEFKNEDLNPKILTKKERKKYDSARMSEGKKLGSDYKPIK